MILSIILIFLSTVFAQDAYEGDSCIFPDGRSGICSSLMNCPSVYQRLMNNLPVEKMCGFSSFDPIVCCPRNNPTTTTTSTTTTPLPVTVNLVAEGEGGRGATARQKCAEYAQSVYSLKYPPILIFNRKPVNTSDCAIKSQKLIVGGTKAERMEFPHMAAVGYNRGTDGIGWFCGGSLISEKFVLTAAHCTYSSNWGRAAWVRVGVSNLERIDDTIPENRRIIERIRHPQYKKPSRYHDIALLRLESRVPFNERIRPACLHTKPSVGTEKAIATGWGYVRWSGHSSEDLLKVTLPFVAQQSCNRTHFSNRDIYLRYGIVEDWMLCAGEPGSDACQGDSGGPLIIYSAEQYCMYDIVGVTSFGKFCGSSFPGVYTRVYHYIDWIESIVWSEG